MNFANKAELVAFLTDLQGQITTLTETVDKLAPVGEPEVTDPLEDPAAETAAPAELDELDALLQDE